ncbi:MAG: hypothetical protein EXR92_04365 [Gemmatimonadetes bacterium]|nr:hypothetical protein [Gemmatimonadota bacterium]
MSNPATPSTPSDTNSRRFYHGTRADLKPGDLIQPSYSSNYNRAAASFTPASGRRMVSRSSMCGPTKSSSTSSAPFSCPFSVRSASTPGPRTSSRSTTASLVDKCSVCVGKKRRCQTRGYSRTLAGPANRRLNPLRLWIRTLVRLQGDLAIDLTGPGSFN